MPSMTSAIGSPILAYAALSILRAPQKEAAGPLVLDPPPGASLRD